jgi:hypothetical protein
MTPTSDQITITDAPELHVLRSLYLPVDIEALIYGFLSTQSEVTSIVGGNIFTVTPKDPSAKFPYVRFSRIGGLPPQNHPLWIDQPRVQFDCYGGPKKLAWTLAATIQSLLSYRITGPHPEGVVSGVQLVGLIDQPDTVFDPPQPRYIVDTVITTHPIPD